jgi:hypothetical protein
VRPIREGGDIVAKCLRVAKLDSMGGRGEVFEFAREVVERLEERPSEGLVLIVRGTVNLTPQVGSAAQ